MGAVASCRRGDAQRETQQTMIERRGGHEKFPTKFIAAFNKLLWQLNAFIAGAGGRCAIDDAVDAFADEPGRTVAHRELDAAGMLTL